MMQTDLMSADMKVLMNHIYEYQKGVRRMVLYTANRRYEKFAVERLSHQHIDYIIQPVGTDRMNLFFRSERVFGYNQDDGNAPTQPA